MTCCAGPWMRKPCRIEPDDLSLKDSSMRLCSNLDTTVRTWQGSLGESGSFASCRVAMLLILEYYYRAHPCRANSMRWDSVVHNRSWSGWFKWKGIKWLAGLLGGLKKQIQAELPGTTPKVTTQDWATQGPAASAMSQSLNTRERPAQVEQLLGASSLYYSVSQHSE